MILCNTMPGTFKTNWQHCALHIRFVLLRLARCCLWLFYVAMIVNLLVQCWRRVYRLLSSWGRLIRKTREHAQRCVVVIIREKSERQLAKRTERERDRGGGDWWRGRDGLNRVQISLVFEYCCEIATGRQFARLIRRPAYMPMLQPVTG